MTPEIPSAPVDAHDMLIDPAQARVTQRVLLPQIDAILDRLRFHRAEVDRAYETQRRALPPGSSGAVGEASLAAYPVGFCEQIRNKVWARAMADSAFQHLIGRETVVKRVFILLKEQYFQNAVQLGNLYVDVANDTVWVDKPKLDWAPIGEVAYENVDTWPRFAAVARRYLQVDLFPNRLFPLAFPAAPFFAIRPSGRLDLFFAQDIIFRKDLADGMRRASWTGCELPTVYGERLRRACGGNLMAAFPLEFSPFDAATMRNGVLAEFVALSAQSPAQREATATPYLQLMEDATQRLNRLDLRPTAAELAALRDAGVISPERPSATTAEPGATS